MRDDKLLVRILFANKETLKVILDALKAADAQVDRPLNNI